MARGPPRDGNTRPPSSCTRHTNYHHGMKKLLLLGLLGAVVAAIVYKVLTTEIPIDES